MIYDPKTGEVYDTDTELSSGDSKYFNDSAKEVAEMVENGELVTSSRKIQLRKSIKSNKITQSKERSIMNGAIKLETNKNKESEVEIRYIPGYGDIIQIILYDKDKKQMFLDESENSINLVEYPTDRSQFLIIPEFTKKN